MKIAYFGYGRHAKRIRNVATTFLRGKTNITEFAIKKNTFEADSDIHLFSSFNHAIEKFGKPDIVFIATPNAHHLEAFKLCLKSKIPYIYIEKPAIGIESYYRTHIEENGHPAKYISVGYHFPKNQAFLDLKEAIKGKIYGNTVSISINTGHGLAFKEDYLNGWRSEDRFEIAYTAGSHLISLAMYLMGGNHVIEQNQHVSSKSSESSGDTYHGNFVYSDRTCVNVMSSWACPLIKNCSVIFTDGIWNYDFQRVKIYHPRSTYDENGFFVSPPVVLDADMPFKGIAPSIQDFLKKALSNQTFSPFFCFSEDVAHILNDLQGLP